jgi:hypothetical protein
MPTELADHLAGHLDAAYATIMATIVETGAAPHYTEVASELGVSMDEGRDIVHRLMDLTPGWTHPGTDYIASFPPFNNQPTQYRISIEGRHGWYGQ